tara:strand:- start:18728 stop:19279 length:552 start_codon:yes stop_codon:yes gene_type:complete
MAKIDTSVLLNDLKTKTEFCIKEAKRLVKQREEKLNDHPNPETWSALQCIDHLNKYGDYYLPELNAAMNDSSLPPSSHFSPGFVGNIFAKAMHPTVGKSKMQSPVDKAPAKSDLSKDILNTFMDQQKSFLEVLKMAESKNLNKVKIKITISKWIKIKLGDALRVTIYHNERHILQAIKVLKNN